MFLKKQLFHSRFLDMSEIFIANSAPLLSIHYYIRLIDDTAEILATLEQTPLADLRERPGGPPIRLIGEHFKA